MQNGNGYNEGLGDFWAPIKKYWQEPTQQNRDALRVLLKPESTRWQYTNGVADTSLLSPDAWTIDQVGLDRPGNDEIQLDLFYDYRTNVEEYPRWHEYLRRHQPPTLLVWGANDPIFTQEGGRAFARDLKTPELHMLDTGHFALEDHCDEIVGLVRSFYDRRIAMRKAA